MSLALQSLPRHIYCAPEAQVRCAGGLVLCCDDQDPDHDCIYDHGIQQGGFPDIDPHDEHCLSYLRLRLWSCTDAHDWP